MTKKYVHKNRVELWAMYKRQAQKIELDFNDTKTFFFNWFGVFFYVDENMQYRPTRHLIESAYHLSSDDWERENRVLVRNKKPTPPSLIGEERSVAKKIADALKKDPLYGLTPEDAAKVKAIIEKRIAMKKWLEEKGDEFKKRYANYCELTMTRITLSAMYIGSLESTYKRIDEYLKKNVLRKKMTALRLYEERQFLEALATELEEVAEEEHMAMS